MFIRGRHSKLSWVEETSLGVTPTGVAFNDISLISESIAPSAELMITREADLAPAYNRAKVLAGGSISQEASIRNSAMQLLKHGMFNTLTAWADITPTTYGSSYPGTPTTFTLGTVIKWVPTDVFLICTHTGLWNGTDDWSDFGTTERAQRLGAAVFDWFGNCTGKKVQSRSLTNVGSTSFFLCNAPSNMLVINKDINEASGALTTPQTYLGCAIDQMSIGVPQQGHVSLSTDLTSKQFTATGGYASSVTDDSVQSSFMHYDAHFEFSEGGTVIPLPIIALQMTVANSLHKNDYRVNSAFLASLNRGMRQLSFSLQSFFEPTVVNAMLEIMADNTATFATPKLTLARPEAALCFSYSGNCVVANQIAPRIGGGGLVRFELELKAKDGQLTGTGYQLVNS